MTILEKIEQDSRNERIAKYGTADVDWYGRPLPTKKQIEDDALISSRKGRNVSIESILMKVGF